MGVDREGEYRILLDTDWAELGGHGSRYHLILVLWYYELCTKYSWTVPCWCPGTAR